MSLLLLEFKVLLERQVLPALLEQPEPKVQQGQQEQQELTVQMERQVLPEQLEQMVSLVLPVLPVQLVLPLLFLDLPVLPDQQVLLEQPELRVQQVRQEVLEQQGLQAQPALRAQLA